VPGFWHHGPTAWGKDDSPGFDLLPIHLHAIRGFQDGAARNGPFTQLLRHRFRPLDEAIPQPPHAREDRGNVSAQLLCATNAEFIECAPAVKSVGGLDQRL
jgi:hypothetical protein